jgi:hypothetical protein
MVDSCFTGFSGEGSQEEEEEHKEGFQALLSGEGRSGLCLASVLPDMTEQRILHE